MTLTLLRPWWLLALLPLGWMLWRLWRGQLQPDAFWHKVVEAQLLPHVLTGVPPRMLHVRFALLSLSLLLAVLALVGPALERPQQPLTRDALHVLVVDLSGQRLNAAQAGTKLQALLQLLSDGQNALVVYAGAPYLVVPPTNDPAIIARFAPELTPDVVPVAGNQPSLALRMAQEVFQRSGAHERTVWWITGAGDAVVASLPTLSGVRLMVLHSAAAKVPALAEVARRSGGKLLQMRPDDGELQQLASSLATPSGALEQRVTGTRNVVDLGYWLLLPLLPLAALAFRSGVLRALLLPLLLGSLLSMPQPASAAEFSAAANLRGWLLLACGQPQAAAQAFTNPRWRAAALYRAGHYAQAASVLQPFTDPDALYNRGNALARLGLYAEALAAYERSLALRPDDDARHNRDLMRSLLNQPPRSGQGGRLPSGAAASPARQEADRLAEQWLRGVPDESASLLRRKLLQEQHRRERSGSAGAW